MLGIIKWLIFSFLLNALFIEGAQASTASIISVHP